MLIRHAILERIKQGEVRLAFRRWQRPAVQAGRTFKTAVGVLAITEVRECTAAEITDREARMAGNGDREGLLRELRTREGTIFRIGLRYAGADPRLALREDAGLSEDDLRELAGRLARLDKASRHGAWTQKILELIAKHPMLPAVELAAKAGAEKAWLKLNVRKLKNLGLTISHQPGYELSPRGREYLRRTAGRR